MKDIFNPLIVIACVLLLIFLLPKDGHGLRKKADSVTINRLEATLRDDDFLRTREKLLRIQNYVTGQHEGMATYCPACPAAPFNVEELAAEGVEVISPKDRKYYATESEFSAVWP